MPLRLVDEVVDADNYLLLTLGAKLLNIGALADLPLEVAGLDRLYGPADVIDALQIGCCLLLESVGQRLQEVRAAGRIDHVCQPTLIGDDLLGAQG